MPKSIPSNPLHWPRLGCGVGLRKEHITDLSVKKDSCAFLEVITENFMDSYGLPRKNLERIRKDYPLALHGVSLSIASGHSLDQDYLKRLRIFAKEIDARIISDHLCWTGVEHENMHQLLPLPRTEEMLDHIIKRIEMVQEILGQRILFENISTYLDFSDSSFPEWEFLAHLSKEADCGILLDISNILINSQNHGYSADDYLLNLPKERIGQFHLGGYQNMGSYLFDAHNSPITSPVWHLYKKALKLFGPVTTLIEWDANIPEFFILEGEVLKAKKLRKEIETK